MTYRHAQAVRAIFLEKLCPGAGEAPTRGMGGGLELRAGRSGGQERICGVVGGRREQSAGAGGSGRERPSVRAPAVDERLGPEQRGHELGEWADQDGAIDGGDAHDDRHGGQPSTPAGTVPNRRTASSSVASAIAETACHIICGASGSPEAEACSAVM